jgi:hypothetical protein
MRKKLLDAFVALGEPAHRDLMRKFISGIFVRFEPATTSGHLGSLQAYLDKTQLSFTETMR